MSEQTLDVRGYWLAVRRHRLAVAACMLAGAVLLASAVLARPPSWKSTSQVLLPPAPTDGSGQAAARDPQTYLAVARSAAVLAPVARRLGGTTSVRALQRRLAVEAPSGDVVTITASGATPRGAERLSRAVATSLVSYLAEASSSLTNAERQTLDARLRSLATSLRQVRVQLTRAQQRAAQQAPSGADGRATANAIAQLTAQQARLVLSIDDLRRERATGLRTPAGAVTDQARVIQGSSAAARLPLPAWVAAAGAAGALLGLALALLLTALLRRRRRRLWSRDGLADALGSPVLASVRSRTPRTVGGWTSLLATYEPGPVDAWAWRRLLREDVLVPETDDGLGHVGRRSGRRHLLVVAFADDPGAVATAAQVASYAASVGVRTRFVAGQRHAASARLWAAAGRAGELRPGLTADTSPYRSSPQASVESSAENRAENRAENGAEDAPEDLVVLLAVLDRDEPRLELRGAALGPADCVVVAVSPGTTTSEELATLAVALDDAGCSVDGLIVADADRTDRTTGTRRRAARPVPAAVPDLEDDGPSATVISVAGRRRRVR